VYVQTVIRSPSALKKALPLRALDMPREPGD
jgi:hypothetical protein